jgi:DNA-binding MarR family transcriptional regulator
MNYTVEEPVEQQTRVSPDGGAMMALFDASRGLGTKLETALEGVGLSPAKYQALDALVKAGKPLALSELAGCLNCVRSNITQLADRLESDGLLKRVDDVTDRRAIRAVVTPLGTERHAAGSDVIHQNQVELAGRISSADRAAFMRVLAALR